MLLHNFDVFIAIIQNKEEKGKKAIFLKTSCMY